MSNDKPTGKREGGSERKRIVRKKPSDTPNRESRGSDDRQKRPYGSRTDGRSGDGERPMRPYGTRQDSSAGDKHHKAPYGTRQGGRPADTDKPKRSFNKRENTSSPEDTRPRRDLNKSQGWGDKPARSFDKKDERIERPKRDFDKRDDRPKRSYDKKEGRSERPKRDFGKSSTTDSRGNERVKNSRGGSPDKFFARKEKPGKPEWEIIEDKAPKKFNDNRTKKKEQEEEKAVAVRKDEVMPLNKYVAHCGIASRREAADLIKEGKVLVNGEVKLEPGYKVQLNDKVEYGGKVITSQKNLVYVLLNKPKNYLTTTDDPQERKTVMELVADAVEERIYPVGRLDRNTSGLLLLTNDGELAQKLSHPKYDIKKVYQVTLDKSLTKAHFEKIVAGLTLEDGDIKVDALAYLEKKNEIGIEIHSGRNRIVRRIFEHLGYVVDKLDRVMYAGLTKKNIPRGKWRFLSQQEVINLKYYKQ